MRNITNRHMFIVKLINQRELGEALAQIKACSEESHHVLLVLQKILLFFDFA